MRLVAPQIKSLIEWLFYISKQINSRRFRLG
nr:MAG TPA: hypothetical protein [Caudoviricetes sp.]DAQ60962.1 MAG TPA: hypothetical protein [Caudoviricetes sp.]